ncbi:MAG: site-2 protease family protein [Firmicutes bacterium]|nr:site-2 protease family protein [Bacillota bacterium]
MLFFAIQNNNWPALYVFAMILMFALALVVAIVAHEIAHGLVALWNGDPTAKMMKRLSPNPARHIDPLGLLSFVLAGIGWAKPVPVNPFNYRNFRKGNFFVSIAGIVVNLIIGFISSLCLYLIFTFGNPTANVGMFMLYQLFWFLTIINVSLMLFNLLPIFPLDGYNILASFTKPNNSYMSFVRQNSMAVLLVVMMVLMFTNAIGLLGGHIVNLFFDFWGLMF